MKGRLLLLLMIPVLSACSSKTNFGKPYNPNPPEIAQQDTKPKSLGSLYTGSYNNLFSDSKAFAVGDIITIKVYENLAATTGANTKTSENSNMDLNAPSPVLMGKKVFNKEPVAGITEKQSDTFQGSAKTDRNAKLIASISARVVKVYPNGNMFIVGQKTIKVNDDYQTLKISGIVKPTDILQDNSIDSSRISDMYVEYNGEGYFNEATRPGWLAQFIKKIWPF